MVFAASSFFAITTLIEHILANDDWSKRADPHESSQTGFQDEWEAIFSFRTNTQPYRVGRVIPAGRATTIASFPVPWRRHVVAVHAHAPGVVVNQPIAPEDPLRTRFRYYGGQCGV